MDPVGLVLFAMGYIALQSFAIFQMKGLWLRAAVLPVPVLCGLLVLSVAAGLFGVNGAEVAAVVAVPIGIVYLLALLTIEFVARLFGAVEIHSTPKTSEPDTHTAKGTGRTASAIVRTASQGL